MEILRFAQDDSLSESIRIQSGVPKVQKTFMNLLYSKTFFLFFFLVSACASEERFLTSSRLGEVLLQERLMWPVAGTITSYYGHRNGRIHHGIDIKAPKDTNIYSTARGVVEFSGYQRGYGWTVIVDHGNFKALYAHCNRLKVKRGQSVRQGQSIASVGTSGRSTGYHLHFELRDRRDKSFNPISYMPL